MKKIPDLVSHDNINEILELSNSVAIRDFVDPVKRALDLFERNISRLVFLPDIPRIEFRLKTIQILLESVSNELKGNYYKQFMRKAGKSIGKSLGNDMIEFLISNNKLPKDYEVVIRIWNEWDMIAGWGKRSCCVKGDRITIIIDDSFLTRDREEDKHIHCPFLEGYIQGFLWEVIKEQYRWFKRSITQPSYSLLEPVEVFEKSSGDKCQFIVKLKEEELKNAFNALSDARESLRINDFDQFANNIRSSIELAFKDKVGIGKNEKTSVVKIIKSFKNRNIQLRYKAIDDIYGITSHAIHGSKKLNKDDCKEMIYNWDEIIENLELLQLSDKEKLEIKNEALPS